MNAMKWSVYPVLFSLVFCLISCTAEQQIDMFNNEAAEPESMPDKIIGSLNLKEGETVLDLGAGGGYFTMLFAKSLGPQGKVIAADINKVFLDHIEKRAKEANLSNVYAVLAKSDGVTLPDKSLDLVFMRSVYHHLENCVDYFVRLKASLKPGGRIVIIDYHNKSLVMKIHGHTTDPKKVIDELTKAGFKLRQKFDFLPKQFFYVFESGN